MILFRLLLLAAIAVLLYKLWRIVSGSARSDRGASSTPAEPVVKCDYCGVHFPARELLRHGELHFCCPAHREAYLEDRSE